MGTVWVYNMYISTSCGIMLGHKLPTIPLLSLYFTLWLISPQCPLTSFISSNTCRFSTLEWTDLPPSTAPQATTDSDMACQIIRQRTNVVASFSTTESTLMGPLRLEEYCAEPEEREMTKGRRMFSSVWDRKKNLWRKNITNCIVIYISLMISNNYLLGNWINICITIIRTNICKKKKKEHW